jgi:hypothetical protein
MDVLPTSNLYLRCTLCSDENVYLLARVVTHVVVRLHHRRTSLLPEMIAADRFPDDGPPAP